MCVCMLGGYQVDCWSLCSRWMRYWLAVYAVAWVFIVMSLILTYCTCSLVITVCWTVSPSSVYLPFSCAIFCLLIILYVHCISKNAPTLINCILKGHRWNLFSFATKHQNTSKMFYFVCVSIHVILNTSDSMTSVFALVQAKPCEPAVVQTPVNCTRFSQLSSTLLILSFIHVSLETLL